MPQFIGDIIIYAKDRMIVADVMINKEPKKVPLLDNMKLPEFMQSSYT